MIRVRRLRYSTVFIPRKISSANGWRIDRARMKRISARSRAGRAGDSIVALAIVAADRGVELAGELPSDLPQGAMGVTEISARAKDNGPCTPPTKAGKPATGDINLGIAIDTGNGDDLVRPRIRGGRTRFVKADALRRANGSLPFVQCDWWIAFDMNLVAHARGILPSDRTSGTIGSITLAR